ncbi:hypothetical protein [Stenotrophomonas sp. MMGLT7]|uniref:hypothetical protein n=1 Tax=Stenotrophomonas sp. MMGLT7 TaxID=2901227 RepID=UPI001E553C3D|nr:hypothetical protein [Stenotrophomonas sp. MMGLT7]MCD7099065.1 hypothetical protein [Stenotrophomonas sp. MMGLT7]
MVQAIIMPDVTSNALAGGAIPFLRRDFIAMTGIGAIIRKTEVNVITVLPAIPERRTLLVGEPIGQQQLHPRVAADTGSADFVDHCIVRRMFESLEGNMGDKALFGVYWLACSAPYRMKEEVGTDDLELDVAQDSLTHVHLRPVVDLTAFVR